MNVSLEARALSMADYADALGVTRATLYNEAKRNRLKITKIGSRSIVLPKDREAYESSLQKLGDAA